MVIPRNLSKEQLLIYETLRENLLFETGELLTDSSVSKNHYMVVPGIAVVGSVGGIVVAGMVVGGMVVAGMVVAGIVVAGMVVGGMVVAGMVVLGGMVVGGSVGRAGV